MKLLIFILFCSLSAFAQPGDPSGDPDVDTVKVDTVKVLSPAIRNMVREEKKFWRRNVTSERARRILSGVLVATVVIVSRKKNGTNEQP